MTSTKTFTMAEREPLASTGRDYGTSGGALVPNVGFADFSPTELYNLNENIASNISAINSGMSSLMKTMKQIGGSNDNQNLRDKIHNTQQNVNACITTTARDLQRLSVVVRRGDKAHKLQVERLTQAFKEALANYSTAQKHVSEKMQAHMPLPIKRQNTQLVDMSAADDEEATQLANQQAQARLMEFETSMLLEREAYVRRIEAEVIDVNQIMGELASIVNSQGVVIESVESTIEAASSNVEAGTEDLAKAEQYQKKYRRKLLILLLIAVVVGIILTVVIVKAVR